MSTEPLDHKSELGKKAAEHFREGYNCAQSVLLTMLDHLNLTNELVPKIATGFGGGIGRCGSVCEALTGGVMAISVMYGTNEPLMKNRLKAYQTAQKFYEQFEAQNGSVLCKELIGFDLSVPEQRDKAVKTNAFEKKCTVFVTKAVEILLELTQSPC
ncbi:MAG: C-GCAxxG-C-C family protein [Candidatus Bathyarchaeia archaeon]